jgi:hypothetical protein
MSRAELAKLKEIADKLEDALQPSELRIEQDERGQWPKYDPEWKAKVIEVWQGNDGSWPPYNDLLGHHCDLLVGCLNFRSVPHNKFSYPPYSSPPRCESLVATPPRTPNPAAHLQRRTALATGRQVPLGDPERLDKS